MIAGPIWTAWLTGPLQRKARVVSCRAQECQGLHECWLSRAAVRRWELAASSCQRRACLPVPLQKQAAGRSPQVRAYTGRGAAGEGCRPAPPACAARGAAARWLRPASRTWPRRSRTTPGCAPAVGGCWGPPTGSGRTAMWAVATAIGHSASAAPDAAGPPAGQLLPSAELHKPAARWSASTLAQGSLRARHMPSAPASCEATGSYRTSHRRLARCAPGTAAAAPPAGCWLRGAAAA